MQETPLTRLSCWASSVEPLCAACLLHVCMNPPAYKMVTVVLRSLALCCRLKKGILAGNSNGVYVFNQDSYDFLTIVSKSGSDYRFLRGVLILPDEYTTTNAPPYAVSTTGFVSPDPSKPVLVKLDTQVSHKVFRDCSCQLQLYGFGI